MVVNVRRTIRIIGDGLEVGGRRGWEIIYLSVYCHHQNDPCIKMNSDKSHFNVSLVWDELTRQCPQTLSKTKETGNGFEPRSLCLPA